MIFIVVILLILINIIIIIVLGRPISVDYKIDEFLDSFEETDYNKDGRTKHGYLAWDFSEYVIKVNYFIFYKLAKNPFNWKNTISIKLGEIKLPDGFQISLKKNNEDYHEYHSDYELTLNRSTSFLVKINQIDNYLDLSHPQLVKFDINILVKGVNIHKTINYEFLLGENLGDSWVALDLGTTGSSIAFGNDNHNIRVLKNKKGNRITPSVIVFNKKNIENTFYGDDAESIIGNTNNYIGFRSIKKLLGYKDKNVEVSKDGKELATILVNEIFNDVLHVEENKVLGLDRAKRAVVTIPNNYTAAKIKDMLFCIESLRRFKEIRFIHEAEAILFYYLSNKSSLNEQFDCNNSRDDEIILVFDMGGATINATVAKINKGTNDTYEVKILSKIGYGIGGDSIDYCILMSIFDFADEIPDLQQINIFDDITKAKLSEEQKYNKVKEDLITFSFEIKKKIIQNQRKSELISANDLQIYINDLLPENISIDAEGDFYRIFKSKSRYCILRNQYFSQLIYANVGDAINEVLKIAGNLKINKVVLSGRSSSFPNIEDTVSGTTSCLEVINLDKIGAAKTAVAEGACWYGVNNNSIKLDNLKTSANFGFVNTKSLDKKDIQFINLIETGSPFIDREQGKSKSTQKTIDFKGRFNFDSNKVNFYQIMGNDCKTIIAENQKHKFSKIASIKLIQESKKIGIKVCENDDICCSVKLATDFLEKEKGVVADQEITEANEKHYTWIVN